MQLQRLCIALCYFWVCLTNSSKIFAAEMIVNGIYQGTNLFVQNPHDGKNNYCIAEIYLNNKKADFPKNSTAFDIDLSSLTVGATIHLRFVHSDDCLPKIMNMGAIKVREEFQFTSIDATDTKLVWTTKGEKRFGQYFLEAFKNNAWKVEKVLNCKAQAGNNIYEINASHSSGVNKYRIKYLEISGKSVYSPERVYESDAEQVTFYPKSVTQNITFSKIVKYEVLDVYYNIVMRGNGAMADCTGLKGGTYYLVFDNRTEKFLKK
jgi:hypothetical protein